MSTRCIPPRSLRGSDAEVELAGAAALATGRVGSSAGAVAVYRRGGNSESRSVVAWTPPERL